MAAANPMKATKHPGVFKRRKGQNGHVYVAVFRDRDGKQHKKTCRTYAEARELKQKKDREAKTGSIDFGRSVLLAAFAEEWLERHALRRNLRERTRDDYWRQLQKYPLAYFKSAALADITPDSIDKFIGWTMTGGPGTKCLHAKTVRSIAVPLRMCLDYAVLKGLIPTNPMDGAELPSPDPMDEEEAAVLDSHELLAVIANVPDEHRLFFEALPSTGLRWSEAIALQVRDLDTESKSINIRRSSVNGREQAPKTKHSRRTIQLSDLLFDRIKSSASGSSSTDLIFSDSEGEMLVYDQMMKQVLRPAAKKAGVVWMGFHTFRHTAASLLFSSGSNIKEIQEFLGHSSPGFTLATYVHLMDRGRAPSIDLSLLTAQQDPELP